MKTTVEERKYYYRNGYRIACKYNNNMGNTSAIFKKSDILHKTRQILETSSTSRVLPYIIHTYYCALCAADLVLSLSKDF